MKKKSVLLTAIIVLSLTGACGPKPEPTPSIVEIQDTAVAMAFTSIAITQAAIPTNTLAPTALPTLAETPTPFPTLGPVLSPTSAIPTNTQEDICNLPPPADPIGTVVRVKFVNKSKGRVNLSFGMVRENDSGECGTYNFYIGPQMNSEVTVLLGCYWAFALVEGAQNSTARSTKDICLKDPSQVRGVTITKEWIGFD